MRVGLLVAALATGVIAAAGGDFAVFLATRVCTFGLAAVALDLTLGSLHRISLGHAGLLGLGAFGYAIAARAGVPAPLAAAVAIAAGASGGITLGLPALRVGGPAFAVASLAFGVAVEQLLAKSAVTGAHAGLDVSGLFTRPAVALCAAFAALAAALVMKQRLLDGPVGHRLRAVRDQPVAARALGIDDRRLTLATFSLSGALAGLAGVFTVGLTDNLHASQFTTSTALDLLLMVVLGGAGTRAGAALGAALVVLVDAALGGFGPAHTLIFGGALLAVALGAPGGLVRLRRRVVE